MQSLRYLRSLLLVMLLPFLFVQCEEEKPPAAPVPSPQPMRYLALGDSYTIGTGIDTANNYPSQLSDTLQTRGFVVDTTAIIATNGWTTSDLLNGIEEAQPDSAYDLVSLLIGVNNQYQGSEVEIYREEFRQLLERAIAFAGGDTAKVWVISIPNYGVTPFAQSRDTDAIRQEIEIYNEIAETISGEYGIPFVNITPISEQAADDTSLLASDNLHPSAKMYALWIEEMLPTVTQILKE